jgi:hypothetical protein
MKVEKPDPSFEYMYAGYLKWRGKKRLELFGGKIYKLSAPNLKHQEGSTLSPHFFNYLKKQKWIFLHALLGVRHPTQNKRKVNEVTTVLQPAATI